MPTHEDTSSLTGELCSLARDQLKMQSGRSTALDAGALGLMVLDVALATIVIGTSGAYDLWIAALALLGLSFGLAIRALRRKGATETISPGGYDEPHGATHKTPARHTLSQDA